MEIEKFEIDGPLLVKLNTFRDERGFFVERYNEAKFQQSGLPTKFVQDNFSRSHYNVLRGLHCQYNPAMGKLVSCTRGEVFDVAVDIRKGSRTYGKHVSVVLNSESPMAFWIPDGFLHGFCVTSKEGADVLYKVDSLWAAAGEFCVVWNDADLNIPWPGKDFILSSKDQIGMKFADYKPV